MRKNLLFIGFIFFAQVTWAQITLGDEPANPIHWSQEVQVNKDGTSTLTFNAEIEEGWHLYSQHLDPDKIGPIPTSFNFENSEKYSLIDGVTEGETMVVFDPNFEMEIAMFEKSASFTQQIKLNSETATIKGNISFMVCNDEQCIFPPEHEFTAEIKTIPMPEKN